MFCLPLAVKLALDLYSRFLSATEPNLLLNLLNIALKFCLTHVLRLNFRKVKQVPNTTVGVEIIRDIRSHASSEINFCTQQRRNVI
jgi:hypothetical protein